jgi:hypothetical protein
VFTRHTPRDSLLGLLALGAELGASTGTGWAEEQVQAKESQEEAH